jgi:hypothetical protein
LLETVGDDEPIAVARVIVHGVSGAAMLTSPITNPVPLTSALPLPHWGMAGKYKKITSTRLTVGCITRSTQKDFGKVRCGDDAASRPTVVALRRTTAHVAWHWREQIAFPVTPRAVIPPKGAPYAGKPIDQAAPDSIHSVAAIRTVPGRVRLWLTIGKVGPRHKSTLSQARYALPSPRDIT